MPVQSTIQACEDYVREVSKNHTRRDGVTPSFEHFLRVKNTALTLVSGRLVETAVVALCHDLLEDGIVTEDELTAALTRVMRPFYEWAGITPRVGVNIVVERIKVLTRGKDEDYFDYVRRIKAAGPMLVTVKLADILDNLSDNPTTARRAKYRTAIEILTSTDK